MAILDERTLDFISNSLEQTVRLGVRLGELLQPRDVLGLSGQLGAGKTAMARGVGRGWGTAMRVTSPTYTIINEYPRLRDGCILYHVDCYRLETAGEVATSGLEDIFSGRGAIMMEWPEHVEEWLPQDRIWIAFRHMTQTRRGLRITASGPRSEALLQQFRRNAFGI